jgi:hypothetical protein
MFSIEDTCKLRGVASHLRTREQEVFCFFESGDGRFTRDGRKSLKKLFERLSALQVVEERLDGDTGSTKHGSSPKNVRVFCDDSHERIVSRGGLQRADGCDVSRIQDRSLPELKL